MDPFTTAAAKAAGDKIAADVYFSAKKWYSTLDLDSSKLGDYRAGIKRAFGTVQIMGMSAPRALKDVYISLRASDHFRKFSADRTDTTVSDNLPAIVAARNFVRKNDESKVAQFVERMGYAHILKFSDTEQNDHETLSPVDSTQLRTYHGHDALTYIAESERVFALGSPGCGKTTFLRYLALSYSGHLPASTKAGPLLPIFIPIREFARSGTTPQPTSDWLLHFAAKCASEICSKPFMIEWLEHALKAGHFILLIDGLDELPQRHLGDVLTSIRLFSNKYFNNKIVATCRTSSANAVIEGFTVCEFDDFDETDMHTFVQHWFGDKPGDAETIWKHISQSDAARDLCRTPLLVTLICVLFSHRRTIPANRGDLYESCLNALLYNWDTYRAIDRDGAIKDEITIEKKKKILSRIATRLFDRNVIYFKREDFLALTRHELNNARVSNVSESHFIDDLERNIGLIVEYAPGVYCFLHLTFQEYLTAMYYVEKNNSDSILGHVIRQPARYAEVFRLYLESVYNADKTVMDLCFYVQKNYVENKKFSRNAIFLLDIARNANAALDKNLMRMLDHMNVELTLLEVNRLEKGYLR